MYTSINLLCHKAQHEINDANDFGCWDQDVAEEFGVEAMPTFILIKKGKEVDKIVGARKEELQKKIEKHRV